MSQNALTQTTTSDDGTFVRTGLIVEPSKHGGSVDVISGGQIVARINIHTQAGNKWANIDVIPMLPGQEIRAIAWHDGRVALNQPLPPGQLLAADITIK